MSMKFALVPVIAKQLAINAKRVLVDNKHSGKYSYLRDLADRVTSTLPVLTVSLADYKDS